MSQEQRQVHVVGCGATGGRVALAVARQGLQVHVWDFDKVEEKNLKNQVFRREDVGRNKAIALADIGETVTGRRDAVVAMPQAVNVDMLSGVVFVMGDTAKVRKEVWKGLPDRVELLIDGRMGNDACHVWTVNRVHSARGEDNSTFEEPEKAYGASVKALEDRPEDRPVCRGTEPVGFMADIICGVAVWQWLQWKEGKEYQTEIMLYLEPKPHVYDEELARRLEEMEKMEGMIGGFLEATEAVGRLKP